MKVSAGVLFLAIASIASAGAEPQNVVVRAKLDPATGAVPGQPVKLFVDILFEGAMPRPPLVEVEAASGAQILRFETQAVTIREDVNGKDYVGQRFEFVVLFPYIANHVLNAVAVRRKYCSLGFRVLQREFAFPFFGGGHLRRRQHRA